MKSRLLSLSLIANAVLLAGLTYLALVPRQPVEKPKAEVSRSLPQPASPLPVVPTGVSAAPAPGSWQSSADVQAWLRSINAPPEVRYAVADAMLRKKYLAAYSEVRFPPGTPRWQRGATRPTPAQIEQLAFLREQQQAEMKQLLGDDYLQGRYGDAEEHSGMPADKIAEINRISRDYMEARQKLGAEGMRPDVSRVATEEMNADLRKVLTPAEYELHQAYESQDGQRLQRALAGADIDDEAYLRAFRAVSEVKARNQQQGYSADYRLEEVQAIEKILGVEAAARVAMNQDATFREVGALYSSGSQPTTTTFERYQTWLQFYKDTQGWGPTTPLTDAQLTLVRSYRDHLTEGLSDADRAKFDRTQTGTLMTRILRGK